MRLVSLQRSKKVVSELWQRKINLACKIGSFKAITFYYGDLNLLYERRNLVFRLHPEGILPLVSEIPGHVELAIVVLELRVETCIVRDGTVMIEKLATESEGRRTFAREGQVETPVSIDIIVPFVLKVMNRVFGAHALG